MQVPSTQKAVLLFIKIKRASKELALKKCQSNDANTL